MDNIKDIEAAVWPKKRVFFPWAVFYSALHIFFCLYAFGDHGPVTTNGQQLAIYGMLFGPAFYFVELYFRFFWWPIRREYARRGLQAPKILDQKPPYNLVGFFLGMLFLTAMLGSIAFMRLENSASFQESRIYLISLPVALTMTPTMCFGLYFLNLDMPKRKL